MRVALLTGGGDCPGLNAVIYAAVKKGINHYGDEFIGFLNGWRGVLDNNFIPLTLESTDGIQLKGGTILHSSRTNVKKVPGGIEKVQEVLKANKIDALIALGGDDTQSVTLFLSEHGVPSVGVPKTIDNDISGTDTTFGFDTAVMIATEAIDRIHTTADSHNRVIVVEVMGRDAGWIAYASGVAGGAHVILVPRRRSTSTTSARCSSTTTTTASTMAWWWWPRAATCRSRPGDRRVVKVGFLRPCAAVRHRRGSLRTDREEDRLRDPLRQLGHTHAAAFPRPMTACWASATACTPSTWFTRRSGAGSPCSRASTSPTSPSRKPSPPIAASTSVSST